MEQMHKEYISSQKTPRAYLRHDYRYKKGTYSHMFLEDFCSSFSVKLNPSERHEEFYRVLPQNDLLKKLLTFTDLHFFRYSFDKVLNALMYQLLANGKAYLEIVTWTDENGDVRGIELVPIRIRTGIRLRNNHYFSAKTQKGRVGFKIAKDRLVTFSLRDLGFARGYFRRLLTKLYQFDVLEYTALALDKNLNGIYDFAEHKSKQEIQFLKCTRKVFWNGRSFSNQHLSESYLLHRQAHYAMMQYKFLDYILQRINNGFEPLRQELGFTGKIVTSLPQIDYTNLLEQYRNGTINASQLGDIVIWGKPAD